MTSRVDKNLFPKDLMATMPEERKLEVMVERMIQIDESLGTIRDQGAFLEKVIEVAMDFVMATRGTFIVLESEGELKQVVSRNLDPLLSDTDRFTMVKALVADAARREVEIVFPPQSTGDPPASEESFQIYKKIFRQAGIHSFIGMPARLAGRTYGYLCLDNRLGGEPFSHNQLPLVRFLCSQISVGLSNLDTYKEMRELKDRFEGEATFYKKEMGIAAPTEIVGGRSEGMRKILERIHQVAPTDSAVLITGETGVGKELVAKAIHNLSDRNAGPFIPVNLATLPPDLVASELFGHEKGAFTGAHQAQKGRFELAHGGTIFLDEIGDLPLAIQVKLLRVLQEGTFQRLGSAQDIRSDFRVIAATNKDLREEVEKGAFPARPLLSAGCVPYRCTSASGKKRRYTGFGTPFRRKVRQENGQNDDENTPGRDEETRRSCLAGKRERTGAPGRAGSHTFRWQHHFFPRSRTAQERRGRTADLRFGGHDTGGA